MSGIEAAGLVLGVIPLIFTAIEQYNDSLDPVRAFIHWENLLSQAVTELWHEYTLYAMTLTNLLRGVVTDDMLEDMKADPCSELWRSPEVAERVQAKLGIAHANFDLTVYDIEDKMKELSRYLNIEKAEHPRELEALVIANPPTFRDGLPQFKFRKRLKFTMKRQKVKLLLKDLRHCNKRLDDYLQRVDKLDDSPSYNMRLKLKYSVPLQDTRTYAQHLHRALVQGWGTSKYPTHSANLLLEHRLVSRKVGNEGDITLFRVSLFMPQNSGWRDAEIRVIDRVKPRVGRRVGFLVPPAPPAVDIDIDLSRLREITDVYTTLQQMQPDTRYLGLCLDQQGRLQGSYLGQTCPSACCRFFNLEELLTRDSQRNEKISLSYQDRYRLAVIIASSFIQLYSTPWMRPECMRKDLVFPSDSDSNIDFKRLYIATIYPGSVDGTSADSSHGANTLKLATLLLEILCGKKIEDRQCEENTKTSTSAVSADTNSFSRLGLLQRWIKEEEVAGDLPLGVKDAISNCMMYFADPRTNLQEEEFRKRFITEVVAPLMYTWDCWQGKFN